MTAYDKLTGEDGLGFSEGVALEILAQHRVDISRELAPQNVPTQAWMDMHNELLRTLPKQTSTEQIEAALTAVLRRCARLVGDGE